MLLRVLPARDQVRHVLALVRLFFSDARRARQLDLDRAKHVRVGQGLLIGKIIHIRGNGIKVETILDTVNANRRSQNRAYVSDAKNWEKVTDAEFNQAVADYQAQHMNQQNAPVYYYPRVMPAHMHPLVYVSMRPYH